MERDWIKTATPPGRDANLEGMSIAPTLATHAVGLCPIRPSAPVSPFILSDRLISLAQDADRAGLHDSAGKILVLAHAILDEPPPVHPARFWVGMPDAI